MSPQGQSGLDGFPGKLGIPGKDVSFLPSHWLPSLLSPQVYTGVDQESALSHGFHTGAWPVNSTVVGRKILLNFIPFWDFILRVHSIRESSKSWILPNPSVCDVSLLKVSASVPYCSCCLSTELDYVLSLYVFDHRVWKELLEHLGLTGSKEKR